MSCCQWCSLAISLSFSSESSIEEELKRESAADVVNILISYLVMFAYISVTLGDAPHLSTFYIWSKYHPDVNKQPGATEKFKEISAAYETLSQTQYCSALGVGCISSWI